MAANPIYAMADCVCHYIRLISRSQNFVTRVTNMDATVNQKIMDATVNKLYNHIKLRTCIQSLNLGHGLYENKNFGRGFGNAQRPQWQSLCLNFFYSLGSNADQESPTETLHMIWNMEHGEYWKLYWHFYQLVFNFYWQICPII